MKKLFLFLLLTAVGAVMLYPLLWLIGASFKTNEEIFSSIWFMPKSFDTDSYKNAWMTVTPYNMGHYFLNSFAIIIPKTVFAVTSSVIVAYGFARFDFPLKKFFFALLICGMLMPSIVTIMPRYLMWSRLGLLDTYIPLTLPALFAEEGMFVFILVQFLKGVPKEFDEAARIDGCGTLKTLFFVILPCIKPAVISIAVFTFLWTMNDFLEPLIMIQSVEKYPLSLALRLSVDSTGQGYEQRKVIAMSVIGLIPSIAVFALAQKKFVSGITAGGLTG
ncbi:carbohydrate ABC transporter permease [Ruminococcus sp.]|uniref:carbohydrate ABC transporter permease n=1 Tax=Ruminococcus sp. TaxID=41978 RepID=UPI0025F08CBA|nr:carbohydrate ABC transporter permease [Ruminococcus sp.]MCR4637960.1 carbohydrate ABC transporter permease [Ruminococcus sp.]